MIEFGHGTHVGLRRVRNEDTYYVDASLGLFLVTDGMGGHRHGEVAAALVRDAMVELVTRGCGLVDAVQGSGERLLACRRDAEDDVLPMGTTIAALRLSATEYEAAWVGDSRIYLRQESLRQISHDDSLVQALVEAGKLDAAAAAQHPQRNVLTQALGVTPNNKLRIGVARGELVAGMTFLLCSDGLTEGVSNSSIAHVVGRADLAPQECVDQLLVSALDAGGKDNVTVLLVRSS
ncbi:MAG: protein phosphatase 2C domain-containing protein [Rhodanobacter sp.]